MTEFDGRCPGCRRDYKEENFRFTNGGSGDNEEGHKNGRRRKKASNSVSYEKGHQNQYSNDEGNQYSSSHSHSHSNSSSHKHRSNADLSNVRVIQDNLVYLIGLPPSLARDDILRQHRFFGQYGKIIKIVLSRNSDKGANLEYGGKQPKEGWPRTPSSSAYITYAKADDAKLCLQAVNGVWIDNHMIRASYGTTKYCNMFLRGLQCTNPDCLYLHKLGNAAVSFTKEEMQQSGRSHFQDVSHVTLEAPGLDGSDEKTCLPARGSRPPSTSDVEAQPKLVVKKQTVTVGAGTPVKNAWGSKSDSVSRIMSTKSAVKSKTTSASSASTSNSNPPVPPGLEFSITTPSKRNTTGDWAKGSPALTGASSQLEIQHDKADSPELAPPSEPRSDIGFSFLDSFPGLASSIGPPLASRDDIARTLNEVKFDTNSNTNFKSDTGSITGVEAATQSLLSTLGGMELSAYEEQKRQHRGSAAKAPPGPIGMSRSKYISPIGSVNRYRSTPGTGPAYIGQKQAYNNTVSVSTSSNHGIHTDSTFNNTDGVERKSLHSLNAAKSNGIHPGTRVAGVPDEEWLRSLLPNANINFANISKPGSTTIKRSTGSEFDMPSILGSIDSTRTTTTAPRSNSYRMPQQQDGYGTGEGGLNTVGLISASAPVVGMAGPPGMSAASSRKSESGSSLWVSPLNQRVNLQSQTQQQQFSTVAADFQQQPKFQILSNVHRGKSNSTRMEQLGSFDYTNTTAKDHANTNK